MKRKVEFIVTVTINAKDAKALHAGIRSFVRDPAWGKSSSEGFFWAGWKAKHKGIVPVSTTTKREENTK